MYARSLCSHLESSHSCACPSSHQSGKSEYLNSDASSSTDSEDGGDLRNLFEEQDAAEPVEGEQEHFSDSDSPTETPTPSTPPTLPSPVQLPGAFPSFCDVSQGNVIGDLNGPRSRRSANSASESKIEERDAADYCLRELANMGFDREILCNVTTSPESIPLTHAQAMRSKDAQSWKAAMDKELATLTKKGTFELMPLPTGKCAIGCRWVFKIKVDQNGELRLHKARLVAKGYSQQRLH